MVRMSECKDKTTGISSCKATTSMTFHHYSLPNVNNSANTEHHNCAPQLSSSSIKSKFPLVASPKLRKSKYLVEPGEVKQTSLMARCVSSPNLNSLPKCSALYEHKAMPSTPKSPKLSSLRYFGEDFSSSTKESITNENTPSLAAGNITAVGSQVRCVSSQNLNSLPKFSTAYEHKAMPITPKSPKLSLLRYFGEDFSSSTKESITNEDTPSLSAVKSTSVGSQQSSCLKSSLDARFSSVQALLQHVPSITKLATVPPLLRKMFEEGRRPVKIDSISDDDSDDSLSVAVIKSYAPLHLQKFAEENTDTSEIVPPAASAIGKQSVQMANSTNRNAPLTSIPVPQQQEAKPECTMPFVAPSLRMPQKTGIPKLEPFVPDNSKENSVPTPHEFKIPTRMENKCLMPSSKTKNKPREEWKRLSVNGISYIVLNLLGSGGSSKVYQVFEEENSQLFAVKVVDLSNANAATQSSYMNEICLLNRLQGSQRVIKMFSHEYIEESKQLLVVLEKGDLDLASFLKKVAKDSKKLHSIEIQNYWLQMVTAVAEIHNAGVIHADLKPANFLFVAGRLKLIDFGISSSIQADTTSVIKESAMGTMNFMAPEIFQGDLNNAELSRPVHKLKKKSDVWSLGCILYNMVYGHTPFQSINPMIAKIQAITNSNFHIPFKPLSDPLLLDVLKRCLTRDPVHRYSVDELLNHSYLTQCNRTTDFDAVISQLKTFTPKRLNAVASEVKKTLNRSNI